MILNLIYSTYDNYSRITVKRTRIIGFIFGIDTSRFFFTEKNRCDHVFRETGRVYLRVLLKVQNEMIRPKRANSR